MAPSRARFHLQCSPLPLPLPLLSMGLLLFLTPTLSTSAGAARKLPDYERGPALQQEEAEELLEAGYRLVLNVSRLLGERLAASGARAPTQRQRAALRSAHRLLAYRQLPPTALLSEVAGGQRTLAPLLGHACRLPCADTATAAADLQPGDDEGGGGAGGGDYDGYPLLRSISPLVSRYENILRTPRAGRGARAQAFVLRKVEHELHTGSLETSGALLLRLLQSLPLACRSADALEQLRFATDALQRSPQLLAFALRKTPFLPSDDLYAFARKALRSAAGLAAQKNHDWAEASSLARSALLLQPRRCADRGNAPPPAGSPAAVLRALPADAFPRDVVGARDELAQACAAGGLDAFTQRFDAALYASDAAAPALALLQIKSMASIATSKQYQLALHVQVLALRLPNAHPAAANVAALLAHVKLLAVDRAAGDYFRPRTSGDLALLLNAFATLPDMDEHLDSTFRMLRADVDWQRALRAFPFQRFTQPRPLLVAMLRQLLRAAPLQLCHKIVFDSFVQRVAPAACDPRAPLLLADQAAPSNQKVARVARPLQTSPQDFALDHDEIGDDSVAEAEEGSEDEFEYDEIPTEEELFPKQPPRPPPLADVKDPETDLFTRMRQKETELDMCEAITVIDPVSLFMNLKYDTPFALYAIVYNILGDLQIEKSYVEYVKDMKRIDLLRNILQSLKNREDLSEEKVNALNEIGEYVSDELLDTAPLKFKLICKTSLDDGKLLSQMLTTRLTTETVEMTTNPDISPTLHPPTRSSTGTAQSPIQHTSEITESKESTFSSEEDTSSQSSDTDIESVTKRVTLTPELKTTQKLTSKTETSERPFTMTEEIPSKVDTEMTVEDATLDESLIKSKEHEKEPFDMFTTEKRPKIPLTSDKDHATTQPLTEIPEAFSETTHFVSNYTETPLHELKSQTAHPTTLYPATHTISEEDSSISMSLDEDSTYESTSGSESDEISEEITDDVSTSISLEKETSHMQETYPESVSEDMTTIRPAFGTTKSDTQALDVETTTVTDVSTTNIKTTDSLIETSRTGSPFTMGTTVQIEYQNESITYTPSEVQSSTPIPSSQHVEKDVESDLMESKADCSNADEYTSYESTCEDTSETTDERTAPTKSTIGDKPTTPEIYMIASTQDSSEISGEQSTETESTFTEGTLPTQQPKSKKTTETRLTKITDSYPLKHTETTLPGPSVDEGSQPTPFLTETATSSTRRQEIYSTPSPTVGKTEPTTPAYSTEGTDTPKSEFPSTFLYSNESTPQAPMQSAETDDTNTTPENIKTHSIAVSITPIEEDRITENSEETSEETESKTDGTSSMMTDVTSSESYEESSEETEMGSETTASDDLKPLKNIESTTKLTSKETETKTDVTPSVMTDATSSESYEESSEETEMGSETTASDDLKPLKNIESTTKLTSKETETKTDVTPSVMTDATSSESYEESSEETEMGSETTASDDLKPLKNIESTTKLTSKETETKTDVTSSVMTDATSSGSYEESSEETEMGSETTASDDLKPLKNIESTTKIYTSTSGKDTPLDTAQTEGSLEEETTTTTPQVGHSTTLSSSKEEGTENIHSSITQDEKSSVSEALGSTESQALTAEETVTSESQYVPTSTLEYEESASSEITLESSMESSSSGEFDSSSETLEISSGGAVTESDASVTPVTYEDSTTKMETSSTPQPTTRSDTRIPQHVKETTEIIESTESTTSSEEDTSSQPSVTITEPVTKDAMSSVPTSEIHTTTGVQHSTPQPWTTSSIKETETPKMTTLVLDNATSVSSMIDEQLTSQPFTKSTEEADTISDVDASSESTSSFDLSTSEITSSESDTSELTTDVTGSTDHETVDSYEGKESSPHIIETTSVKMTDITRETFPTPTTVPDVTSKMPLSTSRAENSTPTPQSMAKPDEDSVTTTETPTTKSKTLDDLNSNFQTTQFDTEYFASSSEETGSEASTTDSEFVDDDYDYNSEVSGSVSDEGSGSELPEQTTKKSILTRVSSFGHQNTDVSPKPVVDVAKETLPSSLYDETTERYKGTTEFSLPTTDAILLNTHESISDISDLSTKQFSDIMKETSEPTVSSGADTTQGIEFTKISTSRTEQSTSESPTEVTNSMIENTPQKLESSTLSASASSEEKNDNATVTVIKPQISRKPTDLGKEQLTKEPSYSIYDGTIQPTQESDRETDSSTLHKTTLSGEMGGTEVATKTHDSKETGTHSTGELSTTEVAENSSSSVDVTEESISESCEYDEDENFSGTSQICSKSSESTSVPDSSPPPLSVGESVTDKESFSTLHLTRQSERETSEHPPQTTKIIDEEISESTKQTTQKSEINTDVTSSENYETSSESYEESAEETEIGSETTKTEALTSPQNIESTTKYSTTSEKETPLDTAQTEGSLEEEATTTTPQVGHSTTLSSSTEEGTGNIHSSIIQDEKSSVSEASGTTESQAFTAEETVTSESQYVPTSTLEYEEFASSEITLESSMESSSSGEFDSSSETLEISSGGAVTESDASVTPVTYEDSSTKMETSSTPQPTTRSDTRIPQHVKETTEIIESTESTTSSEEDTSSQPSVTITEPVTKDAMSSVPTSEIHTTTGVQHSTPQPWTTSSIKETETPKMTTLVLDNATSVSSMIDEQLTSQPFTKSTEEADTISDVDSSSESTSSFDLSTSEITYNSSESDTSETTTDVTGSSDSQTVASYEEDESPSYILITTSEEVTDIRNESTTFPTPTTKADVPSIAQLSTFRSEKSTPAPEIITEPVTESASTLEPRSDTVSKEADNEFFSNSDYSASSSENSSDQESSYDESSSEAPITKHEIQSTSQYTDTNSEKESSEGQDEILIVTDTSKLTTLSQEDMDSTPLLTSSVGKVDITTESDIQDSTTQTSQASIEKDSESEKPSTEESESQIDSSSFPVDEITLGRLPEDSQFMPPFDTLNESSSHSYDTTAKTQLFESTTKMPTTRVAEGTFTQTKMDEDSLAKDSTAITPESESTTVIFLTSSEKAETISDLLEITKYVSTTLPEQGTTQRPNQISQSTESTSDVTLSKIYETPSESYEESSEETENRSETTETHNLTLQNTESPSKLHISTPEKETHVDNATKEDSMGEESTIPQLGNTSIISASSEEGTENTHSSFSQQEESFLSEGSVTTDSQELTSEESGTSESQYVPTSTSEYDESASSEITSESSSSGEFESSSDTSESSEISSVGSITAEDVPKTPLVTSQDSSTKMEISTLQTTILVTSQDSSTTPETSTLQTTTIVTSQDSSTTPETSTLQTTTLVTSQDSSTTPETSTLQTTTLVTSQDISTKMETSSTPQPTTRSETRISQPVKETTKIVESTESTTSSEEDTSSQPSETVMEPVTKAVISTTPTSEMTTTTSVQYSTSEPLTTIFDEVSEIPTLPLNNATSISSELDEQLSSQPPIKSTEEFDTSSDADISSESISLYDESTESSQDTSESSSEDVKEIVETSTSPAEYTKAPGMTISHFSTSRTEKTMSALQSVTEPGTVQVTSTESTTESNTPTDLYDDEFDKSTGETSETTPSFMKPATTTVFTTTLPSTTRSGTSINAFEDVDLRTTKSLTNSTSLVIGGASEVSVMQNMTEIPTTTENPRKCDECLHDEVVAVVNMKKLFQALTVSANRSAVAVVEAFLNTPGTLNAVDDSCELTAPPRLLRIPAAQICPDGTERFFEVDLNDLLDGLEIDSSQEWVFRARVFLSSGAAPQRLAGFDALKHTSQRGLLRGVLNYLLRAPERMPRRVVAALKKLREVARAPEEDDVAATVPTLQARCAEPLTSAEAAEDLLATADLKPDPELSAQLAQTDFCPLMSPPSRPQTSTDTWLVGGAQALRIKASARQLPFRALRGALPAAAFRSRAAMLRTVLRQLACLSVDAARDPAEAARALLDRVDPRDELLSPDVAFVCAANVPEHLFGSALDEADTPTTDWSIERVDDLFVTTLPPEPESALAGDEVISSESSGSRDCKDGSDCTSESAESSDDVSHSNQSPLQIETAAPTTTPDYTEITTIITTVVTDETTTDRNISWSHVTMPPDCPGDKCKHDLVSANQNHEENTAQRPDEYVPKSTSLPLLSDEKKDQIVPDTYESESSLEKRKRPSSSHFYSEEDSEESSESFEPVKIQPTSDQGSTNESESSEAIDDDSAALPATLETTEKQDIFFNNLTSECKRGLLVLKGKTVYRINVPDIFTAFRNSAPEDAVLLLKGWLNNIHAAEITKDIDFLVFKTRGRLLRFLLKFLLTKEEVPEEIQQAVRDVLDHVLEDERDVVYEIVCKDNLPINVYENAPFMPLSSSAPAASTTAAPPESSDMSSEMNSLVIAVPVPCHKPNTVEVYSVQAESLRTAFKPTTDPRVVEAMLVLIDRDETKLALSELDWGEFASRGEVLSAVLRELAAGEDGEAAAAAQEMLGAVRLDGPAAAPAQFAFHCAVNRSVGAGGGPGGAPGPQAGPEAGARRPRVEQCARNATPTAILSEVFSALDPRAPPQSFKLVKDYVTCHRLYKALRGFDYTLYGTRAELLRQLLAFLLAERALEPPVLLALTELAKFVRSDGPGRLPPRVALTCSPPPPGRCKREARPDASASASTPAPAGAAAVTPACDAAAPALALPGGCVGVANATRVVAADVDALLATVGPGASADARRAVTELLASQGARWALRHYDWEQRETRAQTLTNVLRLLRRQAARPLVIHIDQVLRHVQEDRSDALTPPPLQFACVTRGARPARPLRRVACADPAVVPSAIVDVATLFQALSPRASARDRSTVANVIARLAFSNKFTHFNAANHKTKGELLRYVLKLTVADPALTPQQHAAANALLDALLSGGAAQDDPEYVHSCSVALDDECRLIYSSLDGARSTLPSRVTAPGEELSTTTAEPPPHAHGFIVQPVDGKCEDDDAPEATPVVRVNVTSLFQAFDDETAEDDKEKLFEFFDHPQFKEHIRGFNIKAYNMRGALLKDMLWHLVARYRKPTLDGETYQLILNVRDHVLLSGPGALPVEKTFMCNTTGTPIDDKPIPIWPAVTPCVGTSSDVSSRLDILSLLTSLKDRVPLYILTNFMQYILNRPIQSELKSFDVQEYKTRGQLLYGMLGYISNNSFISEEVKENLLKMQHFVRHDGPGAVPFTIHPCDQPLQYPEEGKGPIFMENNGKICDNFTDTLYSAHKLHLPSLISVIRDTAPRRYVEHVLAFLARPATMTLLRNFDILDFTMRGPLLKELLVSIATKPSVERTVRRAATALIPYIHLSGVGKLPLILMTTCSYHEYVTLPAPTTRPESGVCAHLPHGVPATLVDIEALISAFDADAPIIHKARLFGFFTQTDVYERLRDVDIDSYITKGELLQDILVELWINGSYDKHISETAKILLPFVNFEGVGGLPPKRKEFCVNPATEEILIPPYPPPTDFDFKFVSDKECSYLGLDVHATKVYSFDLESVFLAFHPSTNPRDIAVFAEFLKQPSTNVHLQGLDLDKPMTRAQLLENMLTLVKFSRFSGGRMPQEMKEALKRLVRRVVTKGPQARAPVIVTSRCRPSRKGSDPVINVLISTLPEEDRTPDVVSALNVIFEALIDNDVSLYDVLPEIDESFPLSRYKFLRLVLEKLRKTKKPDIDDELSLAMLLISEKTRNAPKPSDAESKSNNTIVDIDYLELLKVFEPETPAEEISILEKYMKTIDFKENMKDFNATTFIRQGELLLAVLNYLKDLSNLDSKTRDAINVLIPYIDFDDLGALPPTIHRVHVKTRTQVSIITLDFGSLFRSIPRKNLDPKGKASLDVIFKYLSSPEVDFKELFRGINPQQSSRIQLKILLLKIKQAAGKEIGHHAANILDILSQEIEDAATHNAVPLPNLDWIEVLHAVPETRVPPETTNAKKDLYTFFISNAFKNIAQHYIADVSETRARFLKDLLFFLRGKPELKMIRSAIAYTMPFIKDKGLGEVVIADDVISTKDEEEGKLGQNRVKELLYQVSGMLGQQGSLDLGQSLQNIFRETTVQIGSTFIGWDVLEDFPQKEKIIIILKRTRTNFGIFLNPDTTGAITMVLNQLGDRGRMERRNLVELPLNLEELTASVLNTSTPPDILKAANLTLTYYYENKFLLGRAFEGMEDSLKRVNKTTQFSVVLRVFWKLLNKENDAIALNPVNKTAIDMHLDALKKLYKYVNPHKKGIDIGSQEHYTTILTTLNTLIPLNAPEDVLRAKELIEHHMHKHEHIYDEALDKLVHLGLSPKDLVARALRRYREHQREMDPQLWVAVSTVFEYIGAEEHDSTEDETDNNFQIMDEFKYLLDEAGHGAGRSRQIVLKFMVDHKNEIMRIFKGHRTLFRYPPRDKMALILGRLLRFFRHKLDPAVITAIGDILRRLEVTGDSTEEVFLEENDLYRLMQDVVDEDADDEIQDAKDVIEHLFRTNPNRTDDVLSGVVIRENFNNHRRLALILRRLQTKFRMFLNEEEKRALQIMFRFLEVDEENSAEDQFAGNYNFDSLFSKVFPNDTEPDIMAASQRVQEILENVNIKRILRGINLWKLPEETQVGLVLYRLQKYMNLSAADNATVLSLIENLDYELSELASEDRDETYKPEMLFEDAFEGRSVPDAVKEASGIVLHHLLLGRSVLRNIYRGIEFDKIPSPEGRLMALLRNVHYKGDVLGKKVTEALHIISEYFQESLTDGEIDPYTFDFAGTFAKVIPSFAPTVAQHAKRALVEEIRNRPGTFKKVLEGVRVGEDETEQAAALRILRAITSSRRRLVPRVLTAGEILLRFLRGEPLEETDPGLRGLLQGDSDNDDDDPDADDWLAERSGFDDDPPPPTTDKRRSHKPRRRQGRRRGD